MLSDTLEYPQLFIIDVTSNGIDARGRGMNGCIVNGESDPFEPHNSYFDVHLYYAGHLCVKRSKIANR